MGESKQRRAWRGMLTGAALMTCGLASASNPIVPGWYADLEIRVFTGRYWICPTYSDQPATPEPWPRPLNGRAGA